MRYMHQSHTAWLVLGFPARDCQYPFRCFKAVSICITQIACDTMMYKP